jgi:hypothetical protein
MKRDAKQDEKAKTKQVKRKKQQLPEADKPLLHLLELDSNFRRWQIFETLVHRPQPQQRSNGPRRYVNSYAHQKYNVEQSQPRNLSADVGGT